MFLTSSNYDLVFGVIILISVVFALIRGGVAEILSISKWFIALWIMHGYGDLVVRFIPSGISNVLLRSVIVYAVIFVFVAIIIVLLKKIFSSMINKLGLGGLNYLIGFVFGSVRGVFICALIVIVIEMLSLDSKHSWQNSKAYVVINPAIKLIVTSIPDGITSYPKNF